MKKDGSKFKKQLKEPKHQKIVDLLTIGKGKWKGKRKTPFKSIARGDLTKEANVWLYFISYVLMPAFKHGEKRGRNPPLCVVEGSLDKCRKNY